MTKGIKGFQKGNPGKPRGASNKLSEDFINGLAASYKKGGIKAIEKVMRYYPVEFLKLIAQLVPKENRQDTNITITHIEQTAGLLEGVFKTIEAPKEK